MALALAIVLFAAAVLWDQLRVLTMAQIRMAWDGTTLQALGWSLLGVAVSFACLASYEVVATRRAAPGCVPAGTALLVGMLAHALSNALGLHVLTGSAVRYRAYRPLGLGVAEVARVLALVALYVGTGVAAISLVALLSLHLNPATGSWRTQWVGVSLLLPIACAWAWRRHIFGASWATGRAAWLGQRIGGMVLLGMVEMGAAIGALYVLLPDAPGPAAFVLVFVCAMLLGIASHAPGGIGVFEAAILAALPAGDDARALVALLLYRLLYNLMPLTLAIIALLVKRWLQGASTPSVRWRI